MPLLTPRPPSRRGKDFYNSSSSTSSSEFTLSIRAASARLRKAASVHASAPGANAKRTMSSAKHDLRRQDRARSGLSEYHSSHSERTRSGLGIFSKKTRTASSNTSTSSFSRLNFNARSESSFGRLTLRGTTRKTDPAAVPYKAVTDTDVHGYERISAKKGGDDGSGALILGSPRKSGVILPTAEQLRDHKPKAKAAAIVDVEPKSEESRYTPKGWNEAAKMGDRFLSFDTATTDQVHSRSHSPPSPVGVGAGRLGRFISFDQASGSTKSISTTGKKYIDHTTAVSPLNTLRISPFDAAPKTLQLPPTASRPMSPLQPRVSKAAQPQSLRDFGRPPSDKLSMLGMTRSPAAVARKSSIRRISGRIQRSGDYKTIDAQGKEITHVQLTNRLKTTTTNDLCGHCTANNWPCDQTAQMTEDGRFYLNGRRIINFAELTEKLGFCTAFWLIQRPGTTLDRTTAMRWGLLAPEAAVPTLCRPIIRLFLADRDEHGFLEGQYYATTDISSPSRRSFSKIALHTLTLEALKVLVEWTRRVGNRVSTPVFEPKESITAANALDAIDTFCKQNPGRVVGPLPKNSRRLA